MSYDESELMGARPFNQRIGLFSTDDGDVQIRSDDLNISDEPESNEIDNFDGYDDVMEEEVTRERVKRASTAIIAAADRNQRKSKKKPRDQAASNGADRHGSSTNHLAQTR